MKIIMLSGGSGQRLWPLSNESRSKQFLKVLKDEKNKKQSMLQRVYTQLTKAGYGDEVLIATNGNQAESIKNQLGDKVQLVIEPERRNTFPAIALAVSKLYFEQGVNREESVVVLPIDAFAEAHYFELLSHLEVLNKNACNIALMGVKPTYPSEKYGYIVPEEKLIEVDKTNYRKVSSFKEKPTKKEAENLITEKKALWNCGVFAFKIGYVLDILEKQTSVISFEEVLKNYSKLKSISFDYEVVEKADSIGVVEYNGLWKDLGTWNTLSEEMSEPVMGNVIISENSQNTHVINELSVPTIVLGIDNAVVVATPDGILVSDKHQSSYIKEYLENQTNRPMFEKRHWGRYTILDTVCDSKNQEILTKKLEIKAGKNISYQYHESRNEIWTIIEGQGIFVQNDQIYKVKPGDVLKIEKKDKHAIRAVSDLTMIEVQLGSPLIEEDIVRIEKNWDKILLLCEMETYPEENK